MAKKRIAVIGSGASGLTCIKSCLEEGLEPVCFERSDDIGGLWRFQENPEEGRASIYKSVIINTSKEMMCFSDYLIPDRYPNFMHNSLVLEYFRMYAKEFDLLKYIKFKTTVCSVKKQPDFSTSGQWEVVTECGGKKQVDVFDGVLVCTGHHTDAHLPLNSFPGIEKFKGKYFHSRDYKNPVEFTGKRVIVIGIGNSGGDLAVEISHTAKQVFLSTRRGAWILNRVGKNGYPIDVLFSSRLNYYLSKILGSSFKNGFMEKQINQRFDHEMFGLKPKHRVLSQHPTINDELPNRIIAGLVKVKGNVKEFTETAAIFEDGSREDDIDVVIFATGYSFAFPFLEDSVKVVNNKVSLYKKVFPPNLEKPTLAIIGLIQPLGAIMPISELQGRWATQVFKGLKKLPSQSEMMEEINKTQEEMEKRYVESQRHTIQGDYVDTMEEIADLVGVRPNLLSLAFTDPKLALRLLLGPCTPVQYRLQGRGKWTGARQAILTTEDRIRKPLMTRVVEKSDSGASLMTMRVIMLAVVFFAVILAYF
ncbi:flavin-containing monooxygenase 5 [Cricetulus griseus]|uniref:Flavin-containing monooxygenase 5 n=1 Tax=Cricetulus griseus TaxID=10029 RepID=G3HP87_CRIGR|nr:flavin-containing monooxygenase 5 [Cricetulus griseus]XP_007644108.1 flavin-containing monooxygenase 5 [Cricetulus griseus]XP_016832601.1 flavin-containing monooxygenase 5 [Cricetulus griseus]XP_027249545.1 flavin-containing monooxygenase 5 [Cricetulus griseus]XP_027249546.1 flavin-containing monooxygenase 5 [Cricetulus griseus]XP_027249547.1 flavin-containing monooxygenase 5 [Cricetulus griseus]XP_035306856.1 flavin-containing monooxygenase 5 [Cricetulus griseus]EGW09227.1 Dimethylanilin